MTANRRMEQMVTVFAFLGLIWGVMARGAGHAGEFHTISGIVERVEGNIITLQNKPYDVTGVPILADKGETILERGNALNGKIAVILYQNMKIVSVTLFPYLQKVEDEKDTAIVLKRFEKELFDRCFRLDKDVCF